MVNDKAATGSQEIWVDDGLIVGDLCTTCHFVAKKLLPCRADFRVKQPTWQSSTSKAIIPYGD